MISAQPPAPRYPFSDGCWATSAARGATDANGRQVLQFPQASSWPRASRYRHGAGRRPPRSIAHPSPPCTALAAGEGQHGAPLARDRGAVPLQLLEASCRQCRRRATQDDRIPVTLHGPACCTECRLNPGALDTCARLYTSFGSSLWLLRSAVTVFERTSQCVS